MRCAVLLSLISLASAAPLPRQRRRAAARSVVPDKLNFFPTIGVLSVPLSAADAPCDTLAARAGAAAAANSSCFTAFYFHWLQSAGARAVILPVDGDRATLDALLAGVNGVLFTGGSLENLTWSNPYMVTARYVLER